MALLPPDELSVAGHAMALSQWHQAHQFCGRCGAPTLPAEAGARRQCTAHESHRQVRLRHNTAGSTNASSCTCTDMAPMSPPMLRSALRT